MNTKVFEIQNLKCHGCANTITTQLEKIEGVNSVMVNNDTDEVTIHYSREDLITEVKNQLAKLGYPVVGQNNSLSAKAKSFVSCAVGRLNT